MSQESVDFRETNNNAFDIMTANGEAGVAEDAIQDASRFRLNNVSISYTSPTKCFIN